MTHLIADIGATHARFTLQTMGAAAGPFADTIVLPTAAFDHSLKLVQEAMRLLDGAEPEGGCFAVAGPVDDGRVEITNGGLRFLASELSAELGWPVRLVNDFQALALAVPLLKQLDLVGGDALLATRPAVKALLGPGSGLGMSILLPEAGGGWRVLPSEGGHADLAPANPLEQEVLSLLQGVHGGVCWETVLSGPGLVHLYQAVAALWGTAAHPLTAEEISLQGVEAEDPICHQTLELFFGLLGAAAGNLALTVCARGGVYIGGGIVPALHEFARTSPLRRRFEERVGLEAFVVDIPLFLILDEHPGLLGAAACLAEDPLR